MTLSHEIELSRPSVAWFSNRGSWSERPNSAFREWAHDHVHPISAADEDAHDDADLQTLINIIAGEHIVAFGEPLMGTRTAGNAKSIDSLGRHAAWVHGRSARNLPEFLRSAFTTTSFDEPPKQTPR